MANTAPYTQLRNKAEESTRWAEEGVCLERWYQAADLWEQWCKLVEYTTFQTELTQVMFMGRFNLWKGKESSSPAIMAYLKEQALAAKFN